MEYILEMKDISKTFRASRRWTMSSCRLAGRGPYVDGEKTEPVNRP